MLVRGDASSVVSSARMLADETFSWRRGAAIVSEFPSLRNFGARRGCSSSPVDACVSDAALPANWGVRRRAFRCLGSVALTTCRLLALRHTWIG
ncbi:hypothetical protein HMPREF0970_01841 [Schaalia odontolytica F0309]|uniref:Uncharacterized protein n=1 Tax=Schaalia odontolytica F0309 TaxID=649742 RepID=D4U0U7_9ACTO|nr:hypothetical protein HMPREF0970_01841 [Schaalia odontolytica F0309]